MYQCSCYSKDINPRCIVHAQGAAQGTQAAAQGAAQGIQPILPFSLIDNRPGLIIPQPPKPFKQDAGKLRWSLLPVDALEEVLKVLEFGAVKYGPNQWRELPDFEWVRILDALERHLNKLKRGKDKDDESGLWEAAHIACNALFILEMMTHKLGKDNRFKYPPQGEDK